MDARRHRHPEPGARPRDGRPDPSRDRRWRERAVSWAPFLLAPSLLGGCDDGEKPATTAPRARSQAVVVAAGSADSPATASPATASPGTAKAQAPSEGKPPRSLCEPLQASARKPLPQEVSRAAAQGAVPLEARLAVGGGRVTWVNFWAAWCVPCKEEIPRLLAWEKELAAAGIPFTVQFVSLDDDSRQLQAFLDAQPGEGLRRTYWLREGSQREEWLAQVGLDVDPRLPLHLVVGGDGKSHCVVDGAVEDGDRAEVERIARAALGN